MEKRSRKPIRDPTITTNHEIDFNSKFELLRFFAFKLMAIMQNTIEVVVVNEFAPNDPGKKLLYNFTFSG
jgi:hypothetical protein